MRTCFTHELAAQAVAVIQRGKRGCHARHLLAHACRIAGLARAAGDQADAGGQRRRGRDGDMGPAQLSAGAEGVERVRQAFECCGPTEQRHGCAGYSSVVALSRLPGMEHFCSQGHAHTRNPNSTHLGEAVLAVQDECVFVRRAARCGAAHGLAVLERRGPVPRLRPAEARGKR